MRIAQDVLEAVGAVGYAKPPQVLAALLAKGLQPTLTQVQRSMWNLRDAGELKSSGRTGRIGTERGGATFARYWLAHLPDPDGYVPKPPVATPAPRPRVLVSSVWAYAASKATKDQA